MILLVGTRSSWQLSRPAPSSSSTSLRERDKGNKEKRKGGEEKDGNSQPPPPILSSRGRIIRLPSRLASSVRNVFDSDDDAEEEDVKPVISAAPFRRKRGRPRKGAAAEMAAESFAEVKNENLIPNGETGRVTSCQLGGVEVEDEGEGSRVLSERAGSLLNTPHLGGLQFSLKYFFYLYLKLIFFFVCLLMSKQLTLMRTKNLYKLFALKKKRKKQHNSVLIHYCEDL
jgi:hypothetical protein